MASSYILSYTIQKVKAQGRKTIRYEFFPDPNEDVSVVQEIAIDLAEKILAYLKKEPDIRFQGMHQDTNLPVFEHICGDGYWTLTWEEVAERSK